MTSRTKTNVAGPHYLSEQGYLGEGLRLGGVGVWRWRIDSDLLEWTENLEGVHGLPSGAFDGTLASFQRDLHPNDADSVWQKITHCVASGVPYRVVYRTSPRQDSPEIWIEASGGVTTTADGSRCFTGICLDVTERVRKEQELERRLAQQHEVARFGSFALNEPDFQKVLDGAVRVAADVLGVPLTKILQFGEGADHLLLRAGIGWAEGLVGYGTVGVDHESQAGYTLMASGPVIVEDLLAESRFSGPQLLHDHHVRSGISVVIPGSERRPFGVFGVHDRVVRCFVQTDAEFLQSLANIVAGAARQVAAADHQTLLIREMAHRAGNMLQLVNSIAAQTFNTNADTQAARRSFSDRLSALARSNYVVSKGGWTSTRFVELVGEVMKPFGSRVTAEGRDILVPPELCFDMGLVLHELATNSMKYGTLGRDAGEISIRWSVRTASDGAKVFSFDWDDPLSESNKLSQGTGFGSKLVQALIERKWNGTIASEHSAHFAIKLRVPLPG